MGKDMIRRYAVRLVLVLVAAIVMVGIYTEIIKASHTSKVLEAPDGCEWQYTSRETTNGETLSEITEMFYNDSLTSDYFTDKEMIDFITELNKLDSEDNITAHKYLVFPYLVERDI